MPHTVVQVLINEGSDRTLTGITVYDRENGGTLILPSGPSFPITSVQAGEFFYRTDEDRIYRRDDSNTTWVLTTSNGAPHASSHIQGGVDEIDGDQLDIDFSPTNYTPSTTPAEVTDPGHLTSHLAGLDNALVLGGDLSGTPSNAQVTDFSIASQVQGSVLYFDGTSWVQLSPGVSNTYLKTLGAGQNPEWGALTYGNEFSVSLGGAGEYSSIKTALDAANLVASSSNPQTVRVFSGQYTEAPMTVGAYVALAFEGSSKVIASDNVNPLLTLSNRSVLRGGSFQGPTSSDILRLSAASDQVQISYSVFESGQRAILVNQVSSKVSLTHCTFEAGMTKSLDVLEGEVHMEGCREASVNGITVQGSNAILRSQGVFHEGQSLGIVVEDGGTLFGHGHQFSGCTVGVQTGSINPSTIVVELSDTHFQGTTTWDIEQTTSGASIAVSGGYIRQDYLSLTDWSSVRLSYLEKYLEAPYLQHTTQMKVGTLESPQRAYFGDGGPTTYGMTVITTDNTASPSTDGGNFIDISATARLESAGTFSFQGTGPGFSIYVGIGRTLEGTLAKIWGLDIKQVTGLSTYSNIINFIFEIWDGTSWVEIPVFVMSAEEGYVYGSEAFARANSHEQVRFGIDEDTTWATKSIDGKTRYWVRIRKLGTTADVNFETFNTGGSYAEMNAKGRLAFYGQNRFQNTPLKVSNSFGYSGTVSTFTTTVGTGNGAGNGSEVQTWTHESLNSNLSSDGEALFFHFTIPEGTDTSMPVSFRFVYSVTASSASASTFFLSVLPVEVVGTLVADTSGGLIPVPRPEGETESKTSASAQTETITHTIAAATRIGSFSSGSYDISDYYAGDIVFVRLEAQTLNGNFGILEASAQTSKWKLG